MKKAAVIGLGDIAPIHIGAIAANDEIELCAVWAAKAAVSW